MASSDSRSETMDNLDHTEIIRDNRVYLVKTIDVIATPILDQLVQDRVLSQKKFSSIKDRHVTNIQQVSALLDHLNMRPEEDWKKFLSCLNMHDHEHVAKKLQECFNETIITSFEKKRAEIVAAEVERLNDCSHALDRFLESKRLPAILHTGVENLNTQVMRAASQVKDAGGIKKLEETFPIVFELGQRNNDILDQAGLVLEMAEVSEILMRSQDREGRNSNTKEIPNERLQKLKSTFMNHCGVHENAAEADKLIQSRFEEQKLYIDLLSKPDHEITQLLRQKNSWLGTVDLSAKQLCSLLGQVRTLKDASACLESEIRGKEGNMRSRLMSETGTGGGSPDIHRLIDQGLDDMFSPLQDKVKENFELHKSLTDQISHAYEEYYQRLTKPQEHLNSFIWDFTVLHGNLKEAHQFYKDENVLLDKFQAKVKSIYADTIFDMCMKNEGAESTGLVKVKEASDDTTFKAVRELQRLTISTNSLIRLLESLNLPGKLIGFHDVTKLRTVVEAVEKVRKEGGIQGIDKELKECSSLRKSAKGIIDQVVKMMESDKISDEEFRRKYIPAHPGDAAWPLRNEAEKYKTIYNQGTQADMIVKEQYKKHHNSINMLNRSKTDIVWSLSDGLAVLPEEVTATNQLRHLLKGIIPIMTERYELERTIEQMEEDTLSRRLMTSLVFVKPQPRKSKTCTSLQNRVNCNIKQQEELIAQVKIAAAELCSVQQSDVQTRDKPKPLYAAIDNYMELKTILQDGKTYYQDLIRLLTRFSEKTNDFCVGRRLEREKVIKRTT